MTEFPNFDAHDLEVIARQEALIEKILVYPSEEAFPADWEDEEARPEQFELNPQWKTVPSPWELGVEITAAAIIADDEDDGTRHFAIIGKDMDNRLQYHGFLYYLDSMRILMIPPDPNDNIGAVNIAWDSEEGRAFLTLAESLTN